MQIASKIAVAILTIGCMAETAVAQEPTKEETIAWLQEKIPQAAVGCNSYRKIANSRGEVHTDISSTLTNALNLNSNSNLPRIKIEKTSTYLLHPAFNTGETRTFYRQLEFDVGLITDVSVVEPFSSIQINEDCPRVQIRFSRNLTQTGSVEYVPSKTFAFVVNDERLGERISKALEHWAKLEQSGAGEPF